MTYSIKHYKRVDDGRLLNRVFCVYDGDGRLFSVEAYSGNCCGASTISAVNGYASATQLAGGLKWLACLHGSVGTEGLHLTWHLKSFFFFGSAQEEYKRIAEAFGMKEVFRFPSRSEPGHDVVQFFVDFGATDTIADDEEDDE